MSRKHSFDQVYLFSLQHEAIPKQNFEKGDFVMNKKLLLCVVLICTMLASMVSVGAYVSPITYDESVEASISNLRM